MMTLQPRSGGPAGEPSTADQWKRHIEAAVSSAYPGEQLAFHLPPEQAELAPDIVRLCAARGLPPPMVVVSDAQRAPVIADELSLGLARALLHEAPFGLAVIDESAGVLEMNVTMLRWFGHDRARVGLPFTELLSEPDRPLFDRLLENADTEQIRATALRSSGEGFPFGYRRSSVEISGRRLHLIFGRDLTELVAIDLRYRHVFEGSFEAIVIEDAASGSIVECNPAFERLTGLLRDELKDSSLRDLLGDLPPSSEELLEFETTLQSGEGRVRTLAVRRGSITLGSGRFLLSFLSDATEERLAERRYKQVFLQAGEPMLIVDEARGEVVDANPAAASLIGADPAVLSGRPIGSLLQAAPPATEVEATLAGSASHHLRTEDGQIIAVLVRNSELPVADRTMTLLAIQDLRPASKIEELERTLARAQRMEALGQMAAGVAHDFNNKLMAALPWVEVLRRKLPHEEIVIRATDHIRNGLERAAEVTRQLLEFARPSPPQKRVADLGDLVRQQIAILQSAIGSRYPLSLAPSTAPCPAEVDEGQLGQMLLNVVLNARDAMPDGGEIRMEVRPVGEPESERWNLGGPAWTMITVSDDGPGIPKAVIDQIFNPFFTSKELGGGRGLGLSVVHRLIAQHGGAVHIDSRPGEGTSVHLFFPPRPASSPTALRA